MGHKIFNFFPGEYTQNICHRNSSLCAPCPERLPSCISKSDGAHAFTGREWTNNYITCYRNRTVGIDKCPVGTLFNPNQNGCISKLNSSKLFPNTNLLLGSHVNTYTVSTLIYSSYFHY